MGPRRLLRTIGIVIALVSVQLIAPTSAPQAGASVTEFPTLAPATIAYGLGAPGAVVRRSRNVTVTRIDLGQQRAAAAGAAGLYRVRIDGAYPARACARSVR